MESIKEKMEVEPPGLINFNNTEIAFEHKSDRELLQMRRLFKLMNSPSLVGLGTTITPVALKLRLPFLKRALQKTIFRHFVGGENLLDTQKCIDILYKYNCLTILDYGAESKSSDEELDEVMKENINALELAASNSSVPAISTKLTGLAPNALLKKMQTDKELSPAELKQKERLIKRIDAICCRAHDLNVGVMIDAEESWMQITIDNLVNEMMAAYNAHKVVVYNTFQLYRKDKLDFLKESHDKAMAGDYYFGAKLVRGAYMDKERMHAREKGLPDLIHLTKEDTDRDFDKAVEFCVNNYKDIASVCATHNENSSMLQARLIEERGIERNHPHVNFSQLFGMSDNVTFNLANAGYNVAKYMPYGPLDEVIPYLMRRAKENTSVTGDMSRELKLINREIERRKI